MTKAVVLLEAQAYNPKEFKNAAPINCSQLKKFAQGVIRVSIQ